MRLDVYSDPICPWCYIGKRYMRTALEALAGEGLRFDVGWRPFQLNPDLPAGGVMRDEYRRAKFGSLERSRQLDAEVASAARLAGIEIRFDLMQRTPNTLDAHRVIQHAANPGQQDAVVDRLFADYFERGRDIGERAVLLDAAEASGMDRNATDAFLGSSAGRAEIAEADRAARRAGLEGVPTFALDNHILFSGAIPPDAFAEVLGKAHRVLQTRDN